MDIVQQISDYMDGIVDTFVMSTLANVIATAIPLVGIAMTMSFMLRGAMMMMSLVVNRLANYSSNSPEPP